METKIRKTFTINKKIFKDFKIISEKLAISKSKYIENQIIEFINKNKELLNA